MTAVGRSSYSLYLWHLPILWTAYWALPGLPVAGRVALATAALVPVVWLSFTLLEKPVLRPRREAARTAHPSGATVAARLPGGDAPATAS